ncbi:hypothetical protein A3A20_01150 [Candidatus Wolfebacteria bacterium RIFCSPLOWO2_01_FULL_45_19]|uniref:DUF4921 domain-containing protein n=1 Tax=Candidatus Wolfebacteria bacterium RIFCSPLOWO2_01_FULL_45_19 TaxID=1802557 RepID=A0A1F8DUQ1_9BACT|nr:MAG: Galactose-1-phosphate uridylyltransferase [Parcubacteria group bacterium GW2011_GWB1_45_9]OGM91538.1 MAG: hypothetical protein A3A20_01150 [Candidatus Wolfebacteria bacterium RIFCSPLOWO2_01_FULL_45_19]
MAPGRANRPSDLIEKQKKIKRVGASARGCPFENPQAPGNEEPILVYKNKRGWELAIIPNKYPAVSHERIVAVPAKHGPYHILPGVGYHDVVTTRDHDKNFPNLTVSHAELVFRAFRDRYMMLLDDKYIAYVSIFHNWGPTAGASIYHPHYQIIAIPVVPPDVQHSLSGSLDYFQANKKCVHCVMIEFELKEKERIIYENDSAVAFAPFVSREPFEIRIFPKKHLPYFENTLDEDLKGVVDCLQTSLKRVENNLADPDYNFFIHTAPVQDKNKYDHYHWHMEVVPKIKISAGFELGTGIEINMVNPDEAAKILRK